MRSLLFRTEEKAVVSAPSVTAAAVTKAVVPEAIESHQESKQSDKTQRVRPVLTPRQRAMRAQCVALSILSVTAVLLARWLVASQDPVYPKGEGAYPATVAPKWREMPQPNAGTFYMAASDAYHVDIPESVKYGSYGLPDAPLAVQKAAIAQVQPAFALLRQGMQYSYVPNEQTNYYAKQDSAIGLKRREPSFIVMREMARMLAAEAHYKGVTGDTAGALSSSLDAIRYGIDSGQGHTLIQGMIGVLVEGIGSVEGMKHIDGLSAKEARAGIARLEEMLPQERTFAQTMTAERDWVYEVMKETFVAGNMKSISSEMAYKDMEEVEGHLVYNAAILYYSKQGLVDAYASQMDKVIARGKMPYQQSKALGEVVPSSNPLVRSVVPDFEKSLAHQTRIKARNQVLLARLAVQAYKKEHNGMLPPSLQVLNQGVNPYLNALPTDPFSATGNEMLRYDSTDGLVYSVGSNGIDESYSGDDSLMD